MAANEGALWNLRDTALIWQVVENRGDDTKSRTRWLQKHSPRALGLKPCNGAGRNCQWSRNLRKEGTIPAGMAAGGDYWRYKLQPRWLEVLALAEQLVAGTTRDKPCPTPPDTWGGDMDWANAVAHGLVPCGCEGTLNEGWAVVDYSGLPGGYTP